LACARHSSNKPSSRPSKCSNRLKCRTCRTSRLVKREIQVRCSNSLGSSRTDPTGRAQTIVPIATLPTKVARRFSPKASKVIFQEACKMQRVLISMIASRSFKLETKTPHRAPWLAVPTLRRAPSQKCQTHQHARPLWTMKQAGVLAEAQMEAELALMIASLS
jgi:hypothetical protein